jgi:glutathione S-transferase
MLELYIANKNYSSWSLRPWLLLRERGIAFKEHLLPFGEQQLWQPFRSLSPTGKVPCLVDGETLVWDSLAIAEYLAERDPGVWPRDARARAFARSAAAEMHSGFGELRSRCSMSCGVRVQLHEQPPALQADLARLGALFAEGLRRFGGPYLAGPAFSAADAFFAPVAFRVQTYALEIGEPGASYLARLLALEPMREWYASGLAERFRDAPHELEIAAVGRITQDLRASPAR